MPGRTSKGCIVVSVGLLLAGCTKTSGGTALPSETQPQATPSVASSSPTPPTTPPTAPPPIGGTPRSPILWYGKATGEPAKDALRQVVQTYVSMSIRLAEKPDPNDPQITELSVDPQRSAFVTTYRRVQMQGLSQRGPVFGSFVSVTVSGEQAKVTACLDLTKTQVYRTNGQPQPGSRGGEDLYMFVLVRTSGVWKVSEQDSPDQSHCTVQR